MKITTRLKLNALLFSVVVIVIGLVFFALFRMQRNAFEVALVADAIAKNSYELDRLSNRYLSYPGDLPEEQWIAVYGELERNLQSEVHERHVRSVIIRRMDHNLDDIREFFGRLVQVEEGRVSSGRMPSAVFEAQRIQIVELLRKRARDIALDANRLVSLMDEEILNINRRIGIFAPAVGVLLAAGTAWISMCIGRSISAGINQLRAGAETIGSGNLDYRIGLNTDDELGRLSGTFDAMTKNLKAITVSRDDLAKEITERRKAEEELRRSAAVLKKVSRQNELILESAGEGIYGLDLQGNVTFVNAVATQMVGFSREDVMGTNSHLAWHHKRPDGSAYPSKECPIYGAYTEGIIHSGEDMFWRKDGTGFPIDFTSRPIYEEGKISGAVVTYRDITERKRAEEELREREERFRAVYEQAAVGIELMDFEKRYLRGNGKLSQMLGYSEADLQRMTFTQITHADDLPEELQLLDRLMAGQIPSYTIEKRYIHKDGKEIWVRVTSSVARTTKPHRISIIEDITDRKRAEAELKKLLADLERSNKELEQFAYVASHDLQEPLRMVASYVQLLEKKYKEQLDEKAGRYIYFTVDGVNRMRKLIDGLLAYSRVARGAELTRVDANQAFNQAVMNLSVALKESGAVVTKDELPAVFADELQLSGYFRTSSGTA